MTSSRRAARIAALRGPELPVEDFEERALAVVTAELAALRDELLRFDPHERIPVRRRVDIENDIALWESLGWIRVIAGRLRRAAET